MPAPDSAARDASTTALALLLLPALLGGISARAAEPPASPQELSPQPRETPTPILSVGDVILPFDAEGVDGVTKRIAFPEGTNTVLLFFLSGCPHCHRMFPEWNEAFASRPPNLAVIGVIMDQEPPGFFSKTSILFPVVRSPSPAFLRAIKVYRAPVTLRVAPHGRVVDFGAGEIDAPRVFELFKP